MVHGDCRSSGCYAMTDPAIAEIWELVTAALEQGQERFQVQVFPFRMTDANMKWHATAPYMPFWQQLKPGHDAFAAELVPPVVNVCRGKYVIGAPGPNDGSSPISERCPADTPES
jgi:murein L,D-transpeptidase YafK